MEKEAPMKNNPTPLSVPHSNSILEDFIDLSFERFWEMDEHLNYTFVTPSLLPDGGYDFEDLVGRNFSEVSGLCTDTSHVSAIRSALLNRKPILNQPLDILNKKGELRFMQMSAKPFFDRRTKEFKGYRGSLRDLTGEITARREADQIYVMMMEAVESIEAGFAMFDDQERLVHCNHQFKDFYPGASDLILKGNHFTRMQRKSLEMGDIIIPANREPAEWLLERVEKRKQGFCHTEYQLKNHQWISATERKTKAGNLVCIRQDMTPIKEREKLLRDAKNSAEANSLAKTEFLAMISHELITPLNAIIGFTEVMNKELLGPLGNDKYKEYTQDILNSGSHLLSLIQDILDVSTIESGKLMLEISEFDLRDAVTSSLKLFETKCLENSIALKASLPKKKISYKGDLRKIRQILINLIGNAVKFSVPGGTIDVSLSDGTDYLLLEVKDTGIGMNARDIPKAMEPFSQINKGLNRIFGGVGLGLHLTQSFVKLHGGSLNITSKRDKGTHVLITLPKTLQHPNQ